MKRCNCRSVWCWLDSALHALHIHVQPVCDRHDRIILGEKP